MARVTAIAIALMAALAYGNAEATVFVVDPTPPACVQPSGGVVVPTIGDAVTAAAAGDRIYVCPGTYQENVVVTPAQSNLMFFGVGQPRVVPGDAGAPGFLILASGVRVQGFEVAGFSSGSLNCGIVVGTPTFLMAPESNLPSLLSQALPRSSRAPRSTLAPAPSNSVGQPSGATVIANVVHDNSAGICLFGATGSQVRDNTVERNQLGIVDTLGAGSSTSPNLVIGNRVQGNSQLGIATAFGANTRIDFNVVSGSGIGIALQDVVSGVVSRNTVTQNHQFGIFATTSCCFEIARNTVRENGWPGIAVGDSADCSVDTNTVARNGDGISLAYSRSCQVSGNVVQQNKSVGITARFLEPGNSFIYNTASGNAVLDCDWDSSDAPLFANNRCTKENPAGAWD